MAKGSGHKFVWLRAEPWLDETVKPLQTLLLPLLQACGVHACLPFQWEGLPTPTCRQMGDPRPSCPSEVPLPYVSQGFPRHGWILRTFNSPAYLASGPT